MKKIVFLSTFLVYFLSFACFAQELKGVPSYIQSPEELAKWLLCDFKYQLKIPDVPQAPQEMLNSKTGDCEDFAALASVVLCRLGIPNDVMTIKFKGLNILHAVCIWKGQDGTYNFISNQKLFYTKQKNIEDVIRKFYPDYEKITLANLGKQKAVVLR